MFSPLTRNSLSAVIGAGLLVVLSGCRPSPETLLRDGRYAEVLRRVRPVNAAALRLRAQALYQSGELEAARTELRIAIGLEETLAPAHRLLGLVEVKLGAAGSAITHLERSLELDAHQPEVRAALAPLLLRRGLLRAHPGMGILQLDESRRDLQRAGELEARLAAEGQKLLTELKRRPASLAGEQCRGVPTELAAAGLPRPAHGRCPLTADLLIAEALRRYLLAACEGPSLALRLEHRGCLQEAQTVWSALASEAPNDPRWPLHIGRMLLAQGRPAAAALSFTEHVFLSGDRAAAELQVGELLLAAKLPRDAGAHAVQALALAVGLPTQLQAVRLLRRCGLTEAVRQAETAVLARGWGLSLVELRARLNAAQ